MKISIITVCYNCLEAITETIESVICQTHPNVEYIVIDGDSTDGTKELINSYAAHIDCIVSEKDSGIYEAMNKGLKLCSGDYILFLNCGDRLHNPTTLEDLMAQTGGEDIIYGDMLLVFQDGRKVRKDQPKKINRFLFIYHTMFHQATFIRKNIYETFGNFNEDYVISADFDFFLRVLFQPGITKIYLPLIISDFDMHGISHSPKTFKLRQRDRVRILKKHMPLPLYAIARTRYALIQNRQKPWCKKLLTSIDTILLFLRGK